MACGQGHHPHRRASTRDSRETPFFSPSNLRTFFFSSAQTPVFSTGRCARGARNGPCSPPRSEVTRILASGQPCRSGWLSLRSKQRPFPRTVRSRRCETGNGVGLAFVAD
ncbi:hypothetical protein BJV78DRAFT_129833 [Lactifluus subvellereus]|nr:hypothetical protein BJV78DRAFT_129833 [Lactifluus subvellereus]